MRKTVVAVCAALFVAVAAAQTSARKPPVPAGAPTRGFAVALLSDGIDYTRSGIATKLARDGEGEIVGWDVVDNDRRPFARNGAATRLVEIAPTLIVPYRLDVGSAESWRAALLALSRSPARVAVVARAARGLSRLDGVTSTMAAMRDVLFIVPAGDDGLALDVDVRADNILVVTALATAGAALQPNRGGASIDLVIAPESATREVPLGASLPSTSMEAAMLAAGLFNCIDLKAARTPADVKRTLVARAQQGSKGQPPMLAPCQ